jgi:hypothetical protein
MKTKADHEVKAAALWAAFDDNKRAGVRFGLLPYTDMQAAEREGYDSRTLSVALMDQARTNGGMRA